MRNMGWKVQIAYAVIEYMIRFPVLVAMKMQMIDELSLILIGSQRYSWMHSEISNIYKYLVALYCEFRCLLSC